MSKVSADQAVATSHHLSSKEIDAIVKDGLATQAMATLTGGVFLAAYALQLGAQNFTIGLLAAIPQIAQLIQIPSIFLLEKYRSRRNIGVFTNVTGRLAWLMLAVLPLFSLQSKTLALSVVVGALTWYAIIAAVASCNWNAWMCDLIPKHQLISLLSHRMSFTVAVDLLLTLGAGLLVHYWELMQYNMVQVYAILFALGGAIGIAGGYYVARIPDPKISPQAHYTHHPLHRILRPFADNNFKHVLGFIGSWSFASHLAAPFFTVFMLTQLNLNMSIIITMMIVSQLAHLMGLKLWKLAAEHFRSPSILGANVALFMLSMVGWIVISAFHQPIFIIAFLAVVHIVMGIANAGITLVYTQINFKLAPPHSASAYLAANSLTNALMAAAAPILGGFLADFFSNRELTWELQWRSPNGDLFFRILDFRHWDFLFILALIIGLYALHRVSLVIEHDTLHKKIISQELLLNFRKITRNFSTVAGLRTLAQFPISLFKSHLHKLRNNNDK